MRVISKFRDYYDSAMGFGMDPELVYRREPETRLLPSIPKSWDSAILPVRSNYYRNTLSEVQSVTLGFCGRFFPIWLTKDFALTTENLCSHSPVGQALTLLEVCTAPEGAHNAVKDWYREAFSELTVRWLREHDATVANVRVCNDIFVEIGSPVFLLTVTGGRFYQDPVSAEVITNVRLANLGFAKEVDPFAAFQEISTFLGSQLTQEDQAPRTVGDDRVIAASKGFDESSFRTSAPGAKKLNRAANRRRKLGPG